MFKGGGLRHTQAHIDHKKVSEQRRKPNIGPYKPYIRTGVQALFDTKVTNMLLSRTSASALAIAFTIPASAAHAAIDVSLFNDDAMLGAPSIVDCTLTDGTASTCVEMIVGYKPASMTLAPTCPATLNDTGGIWDWDGENGGLYRINAAFLKMLDGLGFHFYDDSGSVFVSDPSAGRPEVDNACLSAATDETVEITLRIPTTPVMATAPTDLSTVAKVGIALDGVPIFADAPSVLDTGHMPALDTCGGHIDPGGWYHWHATATDIDVVFDHAHVDASCDSQNQSSSALFGYAFDGFAMYGTTEADGSAPTDLDQCNGHVGETGEYHYHSTTEFPNLPPCLVGLQAIDNFATTAKNGVGAARNDERGPGGTPPGFDDAATKLGIPVETLFEAVQAAGGRDANMNAVAATLGISPDDLVTALPQRP